MRFLRFTFVFLLLFSSLLQTVASPGDVSDPIEVTLGTNSIEITDTTSSTYLRFYGSTDKLYNFDFDASYSFDIFIYTNDTSDDQLDKLDNMYIPSSYAHFGESNYTIEIQADDPGTVGLTISEHDIPQGATPETALPASLGLNNETMPFAGLILYYSLPTTVGQWYQVEVEGEPYISVFQNSSGQWEGDGELSNPSYAPFEAVSDQSFLRVNWFSYSGQFNLTISEVSAASHYSKSTAKTAVFGKNSGEVFLKGLGYYFNLDTQVGHWYELILDEPDGEDFDIHYELEYWNDRKSDLSSRPHKTFFNATVSNVDIWIKGMEGVGQFNLTINEIDPLNHTTEEDAKPIEIGTHSNRTEYEKQEFWYNLTTIPGKSYGLNLTGPVGSETRISIESDYNWDNDNNAFLSFEATSSFTLIEVDIRDVQGDFTLEIIDLANLIASDVSLADTATLGNNTAIRYYENIPYYYNFTTQAGQWYEFNLTTSSGSMYDISIDRVSGPQLFEKVFTHGGHFEGDGSVITFAITSDTGSNFTLGLQETNSAEYTTFAEAKTIQVGENTGTSYLDFVPSYYSLQTDPNKYYKIDIATDKPVGYPPIAAYYSNQTAIQTQEYSGSSLLVTGSSSYFIEVTTPHSNLDYTVDVTEIDRYPHTIQFNQLQDHTLNYSLETTYDSRNEFALQYAGYSLVNGTFEISPSVSQPEISRGDHTYFLSKIVGEDHPQFSISSSDVEKLPLKITEFILPSHVFDDTNQSISIPEYITNTALFGGNTKIEETTDLYKVTSQLDLFVLPFSYQYEFNKTSGVLQSLMITSTIEGETLFQYHITLNFLTVGDSPTEPEDDTSNTTEDTGDTKTNTTSSSSTTEDPVSSTTTTDTTSSDVDLSINRSLVFMIAFLAVIPILRRGRR